MAERRMFAKSVIDSDKFLDMPLSTRALYFHLSMRADDEGFINNPKKIRRTVGASEDDLKLLIMKGFVIPFESGVVVDSYWKVNNYIPKDRFKPTIYQDEKSTLKVQENRVYQEIAEPEQLSFPLETDFQNIPDAEVVKESNSREFTLKEAVDLIYGAYPRKEGKAKGYELAIAYLKKGRHLSGFGTIKYNHEQIYCAVRDYAMDCKEKGRDKEYIQLFSTFMHKTVVDYVEKSAEGYEEYMQRKYGNEWRNIKFTYK